MTAALALDGLSSGYGEAIVVRDLSLEVAEGEIVALVGKNGMGKTTLLKAIMGFLPARTGRIRVFGADTTGRAPYAVARRRVAYTPQEAALFQDLTVEENIALALPARRNVGEALRQLARYFPFLPSRLRQKAGTLSGGEQKMLLISRALVAEPRLLLVDEISEGLQPSVIASLTEVLAAERRRTGMAVLLIEQNIAFARSLAERFLVLKLGEIVERGRFDEPGATARIADFLTV